jgi:hypothetical protein
VRRGKGSRAARIVRLVRSALGAAKSVRVEVASVAIGLPAIGLTVTVPAGIEEVTEARAVTVPAAGHSRWRRKSNSKN